MQIWDGIYCVHLSMPQGTMSWMLVASRDFPGCAKGWLQGLLLPVQPVLCQEYYFLSSSWSCSPALLTTVGSGSSSVNWGWSCLMPLLHQLLEAQHIWDPAPLFCEDSCFHPSKSSLKAI